MDGRMTLMDELHAQRWVQQTASLLDREDLEAWLELFDSQGCYEITSHSRELGRSQLWWQSDFVALSRILSEVPQHVRDPARRRHIVGAGVAKIEDGLARVESPFSIYRTMPEGESSLYAVGHYEDTLVCDTAGKWRYRKHRVVLDTRMLSAFTHLPL